jgi:hypothetical protein
MFSETCRRAVPRSGARPPPPRLASRLPTTRPGARMRTNKSAIPADRRGPRSRPADHRHAGRAAGPEHCARGVRSLSRKHALRRLGSPRPGLGRRGGEAGGQERVECRVALGRRRRRLPRGVGCAPRNLTTQCGLCSSPADLFQLPDVRLISTVPEVKISHGSAAAICTASTRLRHICCFARLSRKVHAVLIASARAQL